MDLTLTFGILPTEQQFYSQWDKEEASGRLGPEALFPAGNDRRLGCVALDQFELWDELRRAVEENDGGDDEAGSWARDVLGCFNIEWV